MPGRPHGIIVIIPRPVKAHAHLDRGRVTLTADGFVIAADEASRPVASLLRAALEASTGWDIAVVPVSSEVRSNAITLTVGLPDGCGLAVPIGSGGLASQVLTSSLCE